MPVRGHALRVYVARERLEAIVAFYEQLQGQSCKRRLEFEERGIEVAVVGDVVVLAGGDAALARVREAQAVFFVDALEPMLEIVLRHGGRAPHAPGPTVGGRHALVRHPDGLVVEYFERAVSS